MKRILNKLERDEKGQALLIVLILLVIGGLIIGPLLAYMSTGLIVGRAYEERMDEVYAADAGIEDAVWKIMNSQPLVTPYYDLPELVNGKQVRVTPPSGDDETITFFKQIGALKPQGQGDYNKATPNSEWMFVYAPLPSEPGVYDTYEITITYVGKDGGGGPGTKKIDNLGFWIQGLYTSVDGELEPAVIEEEWGITCVYTVYDFKSDIHLGTYFLWEWKAAKDKPEFTKGEPQTLRFRFSPPVIVEEGGFFPPNVAWVRAGSEDISISWRGDITGFSNISAKAATDLTTGKSTTVTSYVFSEQITPEEPIIITILTWEISLQQE